jgi:hypothetical protein
MTPWPDAEAAQRYWVQSPGATVEEEEEEEVVVVVLDDGELGRGLEAQAENEDCGDDVGDGSRRSGDVGVEGEEVATRKTKTENSARKRDRVV